jgi:dihydrofolate reductase
MKLTTTTMVTVDGVMQGLGGPDEDRRGGFTRGGWIVPYADDETMGFLNRVYGRADAFLFGRRTYEIFAGSWGTWEDPGDSPIWEALNTQPKYVASTTLTDPQWADTTVLSGDLAAAVAELKAQPAGELQVHGSGELVRWLLDRQLVDEIILLVLPRGPRAGYAAVPGHRPGRSARPGRIANHPEGGDDPGLPAHRPPTVRNGHTRHDHVTDVPRLSIMGASDQNMLVVRATRRVGDADGGICRRRAEGVAGRCRE